MSSGYLVWMIAIKRIHNATTVLVLYNCTTLLHCCCCGVTNFLASTAGMVRLKRLISFSNGKSVRFVTLEEEFSRKINMKTTIAFWFSGGMGASYSYMLRAFRV